MIVHWHTPVNSLGCAICSFLGIFNSLFVIWLLVCSGNEAVGHVSKTHAATLGYKLHELPGKSRKPPNLKASWRSLTLPAACPRIKRRILNPLHLCKTDPSPVSSQFSVSIMTCQPVANCDRPCVFEHVPLLRCGGRVGQSGAWMILIQGL